MKAMKAVGCGLVCALVSMAGKSAWAQSSGGAGEQRSQSGIVWQTQDSHGDKPKSSKAGSGIARMSAKDGNTTYEVRVTNDEVRVFVDGKELSEDEYRFDGSVVVFDAGGEERRVGVQSDERGPAVWMGPNQSPPVMVGVRMSEPGEALRSHLRLGERRVILIEEAIEGLPAAEAGLRTYDIIVSIDGSDDATPEVLQQKLKGKKPGDQLRVVVLRGGEKAEHKVVLRAFDPEKMGMAATVPTAPAAPGGALPNTFSLRQSQSNQQLAELRGALEKARQQITDPAAREEMERAIAQAMKAVEQAGASAMQGIELEVMPRITRSPSSAGGSWFVDRENRVIEVPEGMARRFEGLAPSSDAMTRRLEELEKRMDALNAQMEQQMNRMMDRLEQMLDRVEKRNRGEN